MKVEVSKQKHRAVVTKKHEKERPVIAVIACPDCGCRLVPSSGCSYCPCCGWSRCS